MKVVLVTVRGIAVPVTTVPVTIISEVTVSYSFTVIILIAA